VSELAAAAPDLAAIEARVLAVVASIVGARPVDPEASWRSLGMDSLDLLTLVTSIEEEFDQRIPDQVAMRLQSVGDVVGLVSGR
jgi:acyl carrier protein